MRSITLLAFSLLLSLSFSSCDFNKSITKDLKTGMITRGDGLSSDNVYLTVNEEKVNRNTFTYGEKLVVYFENMKGFNRLDNLAFPGMRLSVTNDFGDTLLHSDDAYANQRGGFEYTPLTLSANVGLVEPVHSGDVITFSVYIWDKKDPARTFSVKMDLKIAKDEKIEVESNQITYVEAYLFSDARNLVLIDHVGRTDETIFLNVEGIEGLTVENGIVLIGMSIVVKDAEGRILINEPDLVGDSELAYADIKDRISPNFVLNETVSNPVSCEVRIWDKRGEGSVKFTSQLHAE